MTSTTPSTVRRSAARARQQGVVLLIALIVLVAMSLAGIAMIRSVDTSLGIAGNIAFKQSTLQGSDIGVRSATAWISTNAAGVTLQTSNLANGYYSNLAAEPNWFDPANWGAGKAVQVNGGVPDAAGNTIQYVIHRMCANADTPYNSPGQSCALYNPVSAGSTGGSMSVGNVVFQGVPKVYYRITTRVDGPRSTVSITQTSALVDAT
jgi:Tfp pilus assembly protein PilX